jgi:uncharacterized protein (TIGR00299 family) protein
MTGTMTRTVWFNCSAGVAGDMLLASLVDAGADPMAITDAWASLGVGGYAVTWERVQRCGVSALWTNLVVDDHDHDHDHDHEHDHEHGHDHDHDQHLHRPAGDVLELIAGSDLAQRVRHQASAVYTALAEVEGAIHGIAPEQVELHEVGALDSILDVVGVCAALAALGIEHVTYSPIAVGHGSVATAHGLLPNPVPAVSRLLERAGAVAVGLDTNMELATPTGVALLTVLGTCSPMPALAIDANGFGAGTADPAGRPNVVQAVVGRAVTAAQDASGRRARLIEANVDDVTGEVLAHTVNRLLEAGAFDAWATPIVMKKGRPAHTVHALCDDATFDAVRAAMLAETGSLGVRASDVVRWPQQRDEHEIELDGHTIRVKLAGDRVKVEHDDAVAVARATGTPLRTVLARAEALARELGRVTGIG